MSEEEEKNLAEVRRLKQLLESEKEEFLSVMSHELRTPMTGVKGYLSMILDGDAGEVSDKVKEYIANAYTANDRLIRLVEKMLKIARLQEKEFEFNITDVDLVEQAGQVVRDCQVRAKEKNISLTYLGKGAALVKADPDRTREVILTMVINAIKFTPEGGKITVSHRDNGHYLITDVKDTGIGISKIDQERIFQLFTKGNLTLTNQEKGTGIGLYLARQLAEAQGGRVWLEHSEVGKGSIFSFALPKIIR